MDWDYIDADAEEGTMVGTESDAGSESEGGAEEEVDEGGNRAGTV